MLQFEVAFDQIVEGLVDLVLEAQAAAHLLRIELRAGEIVHDFPVTFALPDFLEALLADVANVELLVFLVEKHAARGDEAGARNLQQERRAVTTLVRACALRLRSEERRVGKECRSRWSP